MTKDDNIENTYINYIERNNNGIPEKDLKIYFGSDAQNSFWDSAHTSLESFWTSGTDFLHISKMFNLPDLLTGMKILVIGVGQGKELYGAQRAGAKVFGLDISQKAREKFNNDFVIYDWTNIDGHFDIIIMHLVAQHVSNKELLKMLKSCKAHLATGGIFHVQFSVPLNLRESQIPADIEELPFLMSGSRVRSIKNILELYEDAGLILEEVLVTQVFKEFQSLHLVVSAK
jgi:cyclopropane fatty-acyl-phospholipid synthase-like methyltransferase